MAGGHLLRHDLQSGHGVIHVEALAFAVAEHTILDRMAAAARVGELRRGRDLVELAEQEWPGTDCLGLVHHGHRSFAISEPSPQRAAGGSGHGASGRQCWR
ncbi:MAG: hypothetical protein FJX25_18980, partial [Alphaproteobacteria bacterium]|nr:hypothetical protein [Alphaproteobacteria bacterium]